ncbi:MAG: tetratricopeptide repeat protein [Burkholderiales bacterium]|nr:tetratricopeptide repeat protein [Phycisphaerae bacterium]
MARKLNKKFILGLCGAGVVAAVGVVGLVFGKDLFRPSIPSLAAKGDAAMAAGNYDDAREAYGRAASRAKTDVALQIKFVDAYDYGVQGDPERMRTLRNYYTAIYQLDTRNVDIMRRILKLQQNEVRGAPHSRPSVRALNQTADRILERDPKDREARRAKVVAVLEPYQRHLDPQEPDDVPKARALAEELYSEDPEDGEAIYAVMRFYLQDAQDAAEQRNLPVLKTALDKAQKFVDDAIVKTPQNGEAFFAAYNVYRALARMLPDTDTDPNKRVEKRLNLAKQADGFLDKADQLAKPPIPDERLINIRWFAIRAIGLHDRKLAEERYRQMQTEMPNSRWPRLMLAQFLANQPNRREEAITILSTPFKPATPLRALESMEQRSLEFQEQLRLQVTRLAALGGMENAQEKAKRLAQVEEDYKLLAATPNPSTLVTAWLRRIEGGIASEQGRQSEAVERLDAAKKLLSEESPAGAEQELYNEILLEYAIVHARIGNTGRARPELIKLIQRDPLNVMARVRLLDLLVGERDGIRARQQLDDLKRLIPNNPLIDQYELRIAALSQDQLRTKYKTMTETTRDQRLLKVNAAGMLGDNDEVIRIARDLVAADPKDIEAVVVLAKGWLRKGDRTGAGAAVDEALKANPGHADLLSLKEAIGANTPEEQDVVMQRQIEAVQSPFHREMLRAELLRSKGQFEEALAAIRRAQALEPTTVEALEAEFALMVQQKKYIDAEAMFPKFDSVKGDPVGNELRRIRLAVARANDESSPDKRAEMRQTALDRSARVSQQYPDIAAATLLYAQLLHLTQRYDEAIVQYEQTLDKSPMNIDALRGVVQCSLAANRVEDARRRLKDGLEKAPGDPLLRDLNLKFEINHGDPVNAIEPLTAVLQRNVDNQQAWTQMGDALERVASVKGEKGEPAVAKQYLTRAADMWVKALEKFPGNLGFSARLADVRRRQGDPGAAEKTIESLVKDPANAAKPDVFELLAEQYVRSGKLPEAERVLQDFIARTNPPPSSTLLRLALLHIQQGRPDAALKVLELSPNDPALQRQRIELLIAAGNLTAARTVVQEALAKNPSPELYLLAGFIEMRAGDFKKADELITKALAMRPGDPAGMYYRAQIRLNSDPPNVEGARQDLEHVIQVSPGNIEARLTLADLHTRSGDRQSAVAELEKAWQLNSDGTGKPVLLRLLDVYLTAVPPRTIDAQRTIDLAKSSPVLASDPDLMMAEASLVLLKGDSRKAIELARKSVAASPNGTQTYFKLLLQAKAYRQVLSEADTVLQKDKSLWWLYVLRGQANRRLDQRAEAAKDFDAALSAAVTAKAPEIVSNVAMVIAEELGTPDAIRRIEPLAKGDNDARMLLAALYRMDKEPSKAIVELERLRTDRQQINSQSYRQVLSWLGSAYLEVSPRRVTEALAVYEELLAENTQDMSVLNNLANIYMLPDSGGTIQKALDYSARAAALADLLPVSDQRVPYVRDTYGSLLVQSGKVEEGLDILRKAADRAKFPDVYLHLAEGYLLQDDVDRAEAALKTAGALITQAETNKQLSDETLRPKFDQLSDQLEARRKKVAAPG